MERGVPDDETVGQAVRSHRGRIADRGRISHDFDCYVGRNGGVRGLLINERLRIASRPVSLSRHKRRSIQLPDQTSTGSRKLSLSTQVCSQSYPEPISIVLNAFPIADVH